MTARSPARRLERLEIAYCQKTKRRFFIVRFISQDSKIAESK
jgi:hypothetical protein